MRVILFVIGTPLILSSGALIPMPGGGGVKASTLALGLMCYVGIVLCVLNDRADRRQRLAYMAAHPGEISLLTCERCWGHGKYDMIHTRAFATCPACNGSGKVYRTRNYNGC